MQVVVLLLLVASLALLVLGLITGGTPLVVASIVASLAAAYAISRYRGRQPAAVGPGSRSRAGEAASGAGGSRSGSDAPRSDAGGSRSGSDTSRSGTSSSGTAAGVSNPSAGRSTDPPSDAARPTVTGEPRAGAAAEPRSGTVAPGSGAAGDRPPAGASSEVTEPVLAADLIARLQAASTDAPAGEHRAGSEPAAASAGRSSDDAPSPAAAANEAPLPDSSQLDSSQSDSSQPGSSEPASGEPDGTAADEPPIAETDPPLRSRGDEPVWVIDGRPRYHLRACEFLDGRDAESVPLRQAVGDGFTPCALCDPDSGLVAAAAGGTAEP